MGRNVLKLEEINLAIATTGITGNHSMDGVPPGTICFAWGFKKNNNEIYFTEDDTRKKRTQKAVWYALSRVKEYHQILK